MKDAQKIKTAFERNEKVVAKRPYIARGTAVTKVQVTDGLTCQIEDGPWKLTVDLAEKHGGDNNGPNPGVLGRGALGSCLSIAYMQWAAKLGIPVSKLEVQIHADYDARGHYDSSEIPPGYLGVRYCVLVESTAPEEDIIRWLDISDAHCAYADVFTRDQNLQREVEIVRPEIPKNVAV